MVEDEIFAARQIEILMFGDYRRRVKVRLFTDSEAALEPIPSSKQIDRKTLRITVVNLKERLVDRDIFSYSWLPTQSMWADMMTKEMHLLLAIEDVILKNVFDLPKILATEVKAVGTEICMSNIQNRKVTTLKADI